MLGLADITVQKELARDYAGTLRAVARLGYTRFGFRLASWNPADTTELAPREKARLVREAGLEIGIVRLGVREADYRPQLDTAVAIGATTVAMTIAPPFLSRAGLGITTRPAFEAWLPQLAELGAQARTRGLTLAYHNHWFDLQPLDGARPLDLMAAAVPPSLLSFEVDLAWAWYAGVAPLDLLAQLGPRVVAMHWKDIRRQPGSTPNKDTVPVGSGEMGYAALLPRIAALTAAPGYVEVDSASDGLAAAASAATFISAALRRSRELRT